MFVKCLEDCEEFIAGDDSILRELLHGEKMNIKIHYSLAHAKVTGGGKTKPHILCTSEVYYILTGRGIMHIDKNCREVGPHCAIYIPPGSTQYIENTGCTDLVFLCIVDPPWRQTDEYVHGD
ncbi:cupin domain-containing protein [Planctomycetota bacterium]